MGRPATACHIESVELIQTANVLPHPGPLPLGEGESTPAIDKTDVLSVCSDWLKASLSQRERAGVREKARYFPHASQIPFMGQDF
jgi:hypothetical protein